MMKYFAVVICSIIELHVGAGLEVKWILMSSLSMVLEYVMLTNPLGGIETSEFLIISLIRYWRWYRKADLFCLLLIKLRMARS